MTRHKILLTIIFLLIGCMTICFAKDAKFPAEGSFKVEDGIFKLNGSPYVVKAAELHYPRIPREYWEHRIQMCKALGMNTICLYTFWNIHEPKEGEFDFHGQNDIREFIKLCKKNGMNVILRPGPYVCAEWEMGGLPWWLLKDKEIKLRQNDPVFLKKVEQFQRELARHIADLTIERGGPIIMIQVENEYGSYGEDKEYIGKIRDILKKYFGHNIEMFQCDWSSNFTLNGLDDLLWTINFGTGADIDSQFKDLKKIRPDSPLMCSEYWSGWFDKWGSAHETRPAEDMIAGIDEMLGKGISFSLYMTHGGTNFSHWAGANSPGYSPDVTSYDYDAPISESGQPTEKFYLLRDVISRYITPGDTLYPMPEIIQPISIDKFTLQEVAPLWTNLPLPKFDTKIKSFEDYDMGFGSILYNTSLPDIEKGTKLTVDEAHDFAQVFINGELIGVLDRRTGGKDLILQEYKPGAKLEILVEGMGRINFGQAIKDHKGITDKVILTSPQNGQIYELNNWNVYLLPDELDFYEKMKFQPVDTTFTYKSSKWPAGTYKGKFIVEKPSDTFLNLESWGKGLVYINGKGVGRFWSIGPQQTLYVPGPWLKEGENEIVIFDIVGPDIIEVEGLTEPLIDKLVTPHTTDARSENIDSKNFTDTNKVISDSFERINGWQTKIFAKPVTGRYVGLEINTTNDNLPPSIAEIYITGKDGERLSREKWHIIAENTKSTQGNHTTDKMFDLQESTYWTTGDNLSYPERILIDLGESETISGIQYLPRVETGAPGSIGEFKLYIWE